uniref:Uncharacterized protein n=1 Tax=Globisporangium ultimum (strain ATCC 200006 / CBS 805.95 / DAOM BR144) TaxID=431595 RepID=K3W9C1_GLOUD
MGNMLAALASAPHRAATSEGLMQPWWVSPLASWRVWVLSLVLVYAAFQKHLLPDPVARVAGRVYFYPTWPLTYLARRKNYWSLVDSHVFLGAAPMSFMGHVQALHTRGVRAVINLCDEYSGPLLQYKKLHIAQLHLPTIDHTEPSLEDIETAIAFIKEKKESGVRVYVHCKGGNGRSAAIVFCWLLYARNMTLLEAQEYISEKRSVRKKLYTQPYIVAYYNKLQAAATAAHGNKAT